MIKQSLKKQTDNLKGLAKGKITALDKDKRSSITNVKWRKHIKKEKWKVDLEDPVDLETPVKLPSRMTKQKELDEKVLREIKEEKFFLPKDRFRGRGIWRTLTIKINNYT